MGMWDEMCVVCGGPLMAPIMGMDLFHGEESEAEAKFLRALSFEGLEWLDERVGIAEAEEVISLGEYSGYGSFDLKNNAYFSCATTFRFIEPWPQGDPYGLVCHKKCYELLERDLQYTLRFHDVWPMLMQQELGGWLDGTDYGGVAEYIDQSFFYQGLYLDGKGWMLQDPTTNRENGERIVKLWRSIIQSGFKAVEGEERGEDGSQAATETANDSGVESRVQNLHSQEKLQPL